MVAAPLALLKSDSVAYSRLIFRLCAPTRCGNCGFTLFPAKGREWKFFPTDFRCPACGSEKDDFYDINDPDDPRNQEGAIQPEDRGAWRGKERKSLVYWEGRWMTWCCIQKDRGYRSSDHSVTPVRRRVSIASRDSLALPLGSKAMPSLLRPQQICTRTAASPWTTTRRGRPRKRTGRRRRPGRRTSSQLGGLNG
jgi:rubredoxin